MAELVIIASLEITERQNPKELFYPYKANTCGRGVDVQFFSK